MYGLSLESNVISVKSGGVECTLVFGIKFELGLAKGHFVQRTCPVFQISLIYVNYSLNN